MTVSNLQCDACGVPLTGLARANTPEPTEGVRFSYHPGDPAMRDDSGTLCLSCWEARKQWLGSPRSRECAVCGRRLRRHTSLFLRRIDQPPSWRLCAPHAADLFNGLRTVWPKFDRDTFRLPLDRGSGHRDRAE